MLIEALVYIGLFLVILGLAFSLMYRLVDNSLVLRRNADDIVAAVRAGERWRADVRQAVEIIGPEVTDEGEVVHVSSPKRLVSYKFDSTNVWLKAGEAPWVRLLQNVRASEMKAERRQHVVAWRWDLELAPRAKGYTKPSKVRPLFTFLAVPSKSPAQ